jgi:hypothetical protein
VADDGTGLEATFTDEDSEKLLVIARFLGLSGARAHHWLASIFESSWNLERAQVRVELSPAGSRGSRRLIVQAEGDRLLDALRIYRQRHSKVNVAVGPVTVQVHPPLIEQEAIFTAASKLVERECNSLTPLQKLKAKSIVGTGCHVLIGPLRRDWMKRAGVDDHSADCRIAFDRQIKEEWTGLFPNSSLFPLRKGPAIYALLASFEAKESAASAAATLKFGLSGTFAKSKDHLTAIMQVHAPREYLNLVSREHVERLARRTPVARDGQIH